MNRQEIFDKAYKGLRDQGFQASVSEDTCAYRAPNGFKCAIGHCIPDELYDPAIEGHSVWGDGSPVVRAMGLDVDALTNGDFAWLSGLQECHDACMGSRNMEKNLKFFAEHYNLEIPD